MQQILLALLIILLVVGGLSLLMFRHGFFPSLQQSRSNKKMVLEIPVNTFLPLTGTIAGPDFDLPKDFKVIYSGALQSPTICYLRDEDGQDLGFIINFGNGKAGQVNGVTTITGRRDDLSIQITFSGGSVSA